MGPAVTAARYWVRVGLDRRRNGSKAEDEGREALSNYPAEKHFDNRVPKLVNLD